VEPSKTSIVQALRLLLTRKNIIITSAIFVVLVGLTIAGLVYRQQTIAKNARNNNAGAVVQDLEYQTVLPTGKSITDLGGWKRISPTDSEPVYAYADKIGDATISVSEQPLPKSFIGDTDNQVAELAKKFNANTKIDAGDTKIYIGSSADGPQSVIFTKNSLLILMKSQVKIDDNAWAEYAQSLS